MVMRRLKIAYPGTDDVSERSGLSSILNVDLRIEVSDMYHLKLLERKFSSGKGAK